MTIQKYINVRFNQKKINLLIFRKYLKIIALLEKTKNNET
jgi:hypothetical protein